MRLSLSKWNDKIIELSAVKKIKEKELETVSSKKESSLRQLERIRKFQGILSEAVRITQKSLEIQVSSVVTSLLHSISEDPYDFIVRFVPRRNAIECDLLFERDGKKLHILESCGHGCADLASMGLKISYQNLRKGIRPVLIMDEPFRQLQKDLHQTVANVLKEVSEKANIQFIIITHEKNIIQNADKSFEIKIEEGVSYAY